MAVSSDEDGLCPCNTMPADECDGLGVGNCAAIIYDDTDLVPSDEDDE